MSNIVLLIIILGRIEFLASRMSLVLLLYMLFLFGFIFITCPIDLYDCEGVFNYIEDMMKKFKVKITLVILIISGITSALIPTKEELIVYYGSKQITVQNYHIAKDELLGFVKDIKKEINKD
jgi:hypothetical protein